MRTGKFLPILALVYALPGHAIEFQFDNPAWRSNLDSTITYGTQFRTKDQNLTLVTDDNRNDANKNFDYGFMQNSIRILSEFELEYNAANGNRYGFFTRGTAYYDTAIARWDSDNDSAGIINTVSPRGNITQTFFDDANSSTTYGGTVPNGEFHDDTVDRVGRGAELLDFMFFSDLGTLSDHPVTFRIGKQVISWGESAVIQNGISAVINYADVNKSTLPGVEVKEILRPSQAIFGSVALNSNLTFKAYWQYDWHPNITPSYGAQLTGLPDFLSDDGAEHILLPQDVLSEFLFFRAGLGITNPNLMSVSHIPVNREPNDDASDTGQWGVALTWFVPQLGDTEFGFYALNYHRKLPDLVVKNRGGTLITDVPGINPATGVPYTSFTDDCNRWAAIDPTEIADCAALGFVGDAIDPGTYQIKFYEDVQVLAFSWNTVIP